MMATRTMCHSSICYLALYRASQCDVANCTPDRALNALFSRPRHFCGSSLGDVLGRGMGESREFCGHQSCTVLHRYAEYATGVRRFKSMSQYVITHSSNYEPGGRGFDSCRARHTIKGLQRCGPFSFLALRDFWVTFSRDCRKQCHRSRASSRIDPVHRLEELGIFRSRVVRCHAPVVVSQQHLSRLEAHASRSQSTAERVLQVVHPIVRETIWRRSVDLFSVSTRRARVATRCCSSTSTLDPGDGTRIPDAARDRHR